MSYACQLPDEDLEAIFRKHIEAPWVSFRAYVVTRALAWD